MPVKDSYFFSYFLFLCCYFCCIHNWCFWKIYNICSHIKILIFNKKKGEPNWIHFAFFSTFIFDGNSTIIKQIRELWLWTNQPTTQKKNKNKNFNLSTFTTVNCWCSCILSIEKHILLLLFENLFTFVTSLRMLYRKTKTWKMIKNVSANKNKNRNFVYKIRIIVCLIFG